MSHENDILIVEDSPAIGMLLKSYLEKLGYSKIHICETGADAISTFNELVAKNIQPIVLLDYMLPDMDARSILTQMLEMQPNVRVILETASSKDDDNIKELIRLGVYHYLEKPIRFESLKNIIETIEKEEIFFTNESEQIELLKKAEQKAHDKVIEHIDFIFESTNLISLNKITDILGFSDDLIINYLHKLEQEGKIIQSGEKKEIACNQCDSVKNSTIFYCPNCKSSNFKLGKLIEHYNCGNVSEESKYVDGKCPSCKKEIKAIGVDYKVLSNHYLCNKCEEIFPELTTIFQCLKCDNRFNLSEANWKTSPQYKVI